MKSQIDWNLVLYINLKEYEVPINVCSVFDTFLFESPLVSSSSIIIHTDFAMIANLTLNWKPHLKNLTSPFLPPPRKHLNLSVNQQI